MWDGGIDAAYHGGNGKVYFFKGGEYVRYDMAADRADPGYPKPIAGKWPGVWDGGIEVAFNGGNGKAYLFKGGEYVRYDIARGDGNLGTSGSWKRLGPAAIEVVVTRDGRTDREVLRNLSCADGVLKLAR